MRIDVSRYNKALLFFYSLLKYYILLAWVKIEALFNRRPVSRLNLGDHAGRNFPTLVLSGEIALRKRESVGQAVRELAEQGQCDLGLTFADVEQTIEFQTLFQSQRMVNLFWYEDLLVELGNLKIGVSCFRRAKGTPSVLEILRRRNGLKQQGAHIVIAYVERGKHSFKIYSDEIKRIAKCGYQCVAGSGQKIYGRRNMRTWNFSEANLFYSLGKISDKMGRETDRRMSVVIKMAIDKEKRRISRQGYTRSRVEKQGDAAQFSVLREPGRQWNSDLRRRQLHQIQKKMRGLRKWNELILLKDIFRGLNQEIPEKFSYLGEYSVNYICSRTIELAPGNVFFFRQQFRDKNDAKSESEILRLKLIFRALMRKTLFIFSYRKLLSWIPHVVIKDSMEAHISAMAEYRKRLDARFVGITGSVGKTSTKDMLFDVLSEQFRTEKSSRNSNVQIRIGINLQKALPETEIFIQEIGGGRPGGASRHSRMISPDVAVITNIGTAHLGNFQSQQDLMRHKLGIAEGLREDGLLFLNGDDPLLKEAVPSCRVCRFAVENKNADYYVENLRETGNQTFFDVVCRDGRWPVVLNVPGTYNVRNAVCCFAIGRHFGMDEKDIIRGISKFRTSGTRQNLVNVGGYFLFVDCFNASLSSVESSLDVLKKMEIQGKKKKIAIIGDVTGMGEKEEEINRNIAQVLSNAAGDLDHLVLYGENGRQIYNMMTGRRDHVQVLGKKKELNRWMERNIARGDIALFKGSSKTKLDERIDDVYGTNFADGKYVEESRFAVRKQKGVAYRLFEEHGTVFRCYDRKKEVRIKDRFGRRVVKKIYVNSFKENSYIEEITLGKYVSHIGSRSFKNCKNLLRVLSMANLRFIGREAFAGCSRLTDPTFGETLKSIGPRAFYGCESMEEVRIPETARRSGKRPFMIAGICSGLLWRKVCFKWGKWRWPIAPG